MAPKSVAPSFGAAATGRSRDPKRAAEACRGFLARSKLTLSTMDNSTYRAWAAVVLGLCLSRAPSRPCAALHHDRGSRVLNERSVRMRRLC